MISQDIHGCSFLVTRVMLLQPSNHLFREYKEFETTIKKVRSDNGSELKIQELMSFEMNLELGINSRPSTLHNQMDLLIGRIEL